VKPLTAFLKFERNEGELHNNLTAFYFLNYFPPPVYYDFGYLQWCESVCPHAKVA